MRIIITLLLFTQFAFAQDESVGYSTSNKDTLYLVNDEAGRLIDQLWSNEPNESKPVIIFTDIYTIREMYRTKSTKRPGVRFIVNQ